jgi:hypothetical protein
MRRQDRPIEVLAYPGLPECVRSLWVFFDDEVVVLRPPGSLAGETCTGDGADR